MAVRIGKACTSPGIFPPPFRRSSERNKLRRRTP
ncbi:hypothetical protein MPTK2_4g02420 [Marchantia polymorpha subsp. ruderalis]